MKPKNSGYILLIVVGVAMAFLLFASFQSKSVKIPRDANHLPLLAMIAEGGNREVTERECFGCHGSQAVPLSRKHPPKEQCLLCHQAET